MVNIKNIFKTVAIVTAFSCVERFLGFIYRIYLSRTLGAEYLGLYQISLSVLGLFMTMTSSGIPITVSRMITHKKSALRNASGSETVTAGIVLAVATGIPITMIVMLKSDWISFMFSDERCTELLKIMIPGLTLTSVYAVIRGSFWSGSSFKTYSIIELAEECVMLIAGVVLITLTTDPAAGPEMAARAVLISYIFSFTLSFAVYVLRGGRIKNPVKELKPLIKSSVPITAMRTSTSLVGTLVSTLLPARMISNGTDKTVAVSEFGKIYGMAFPLIFMPSTLIGSLALVLVPELADNYYSGKNITLKKNVEKAVTVSCFVACMIIPVFLCLGEQIGEIIYSDASAGKYIVKTALMMLPMSLSIISTSILNSLEREKLTLMTFAAGAALLIGSIYFLPSVIGADALSIGMILNYTATSAINLVCLKNILKVKPKYFAYIGKSCAIMLPSAAIGFFVKNMMSAYADPIVTTAVTGAIILSFELTLFFVFGLLEFGDKNYKEYLLKIFMRKIGGRSKRKRA